MAIETGTAKKDNKKSGAGKKGATRAGGPDKLRSPKASKDKKPPRGGVRGG